MLQDRRPKARKVRLIFEKDGLQVRSIKWRAPLATNASGAGYKACLKKDPCVYCSNPSQSWEHIKPKSEGGQNGWLNIARACLKCNGSRSSTPLLKFLVDRRKNQ